MPQVLRFNNWHPKLNRLFQYWDDKRGDRPMPSRSDIDPVDIPDLLSVIVLVDVRHDPLEFTDRLVGTAVVEILGKDTTGHEPTRALPGTFRKVIPPLWRDCVRSCDPVRSSFRTEVYRRFETLECLALPLSEDGQQVNMLLAGLLPRNQGRGFRPVQAGRGRPKLRLVIGGLEQGLTSNAGGG